MNERTPSTLVAALLTLAVVTGRTPEASAQSAVTITREEALRAAVAESPALRGAGLEAASARWGEEAEVARYPLTLVLDGGYTHSASLQPDPVEGAGAVTFGDALETGAELRKHLRLGTDLSLRVAGSWRTNEGLTPAGEELTLGPHWGFGVRAAVVQPLLRGAGTEIGEAAVRVAEAQRTSAELARDRTASGLVRDVTNAYWELWYASRSVEIERDSLGLAERQRADTQGLIDTGSRAPADGLSFETRVATRQESLLVAELQERQRAIALSQLLGRPPASLRAAPSAPPAAEAPRAEALRAALASSPEVREGVAAVRVARLQAVTAGDASRARLDLDGYLEASGLSTDTVAPALGQVGALDAVSGHVGLTLELPLDDAARRADVARADLAVQAAEARLAAVQREVEATLETQLASAQTARRRIELAEATVAVAEKQVQSESARFAAGASTPLTVLEAQDALRAAKLRALRARVDAALARTELAHLSGTLLEQEGLRRATVGGSARGAGDQGRGQAPVRAAF